MRKKRLLLSLILCLFLLPLCGFSGCEETEETVDPADIISYKFNKTRLLLILRDNEESVSDGRDSFNEGVTKDILYAVFMESPDRYGINGYENISFAVEPVSPGVSKMINGFADEFRDAECETEIAGDITYIYPVKDGQTLQEVLLKNGLMAMDPAYNGRYRDKFLALNNNARNEKISAFSDTYNPGWIESETAPVTMYSLFPADIRDIPSTTGKIVATVDYGDSVTLTKKVVRFGDNSTNYYKVDGDVKGYILADLLWDKEPNILEKPRVLPPVWPSENYQLNVQYISQIPELPNGCEVTSLAMAMNYAGIYASKTDLSDHYLPKSPDIHADPEFFYLLEPRNNGYYCFAGALARCAGNFADATNTKLSVNNLTGSDESELYRAIREGHPVIVWGTTKWEEPMKHPSGLYGNLHCVLLTGYTDTTVTLLDPLYGIDYRTIDRTTFETIWRLMGQRALLVY